MMNIEENYQEVYKLICTRSLEPFLSEFEDAVDVIENPIKEDDERVTVWMAVENYTVEELNEIIYCEFMANKHMIERSLSAVKLQLMQDSIEGKLPTDLDNLDMLKLLNKGLQKG